MTGGLKPYPEYREPGLPWLGQIPAHWEVRRNGRLFSQRNETGFADLPILEVSLKTGVRVRNFGDGKRKQIMADHAKYKRAVRADIAYNMMRLWQGAVGVAPVDGLVSPAYVVANPHPGVDSRYYAYLFRISAYMEEVNKYSHGIVTDRNRLYWDEFKQMPSVFPPPDEQRAITRYLDHQNLAISRLIQNKRTQIALLNEQKQALIHRAVTRGLAPSVPLKPSGISWLGDIPHHWELRRLRHLIKGRLTYGANAAAEFTNPDWPRYIRITDFRADGSLKPETFRSLPPDIACDYMVDPGDILLARSGATVGKAFLVVNLTGAACHAGYLIRARPNRNLVSPEFLFAFTQSRAFVGWKDSTFNTATIQNIGADKYANLPVPLPSLDEQQAILDSVAVAQVPLLATVARLEREIELLREYRTRLVTDLVTGKLDGQEAAFNIQADVDESEEVIASGEEDETDEMQEAGADDE